MYRSAKRWQRAHRSVSLERGMFLALAWVVVFLPFLLACGQELHGQAPRIDSIDPSQGPIAGGTEVTISGANLQDATVSVDKVAAGPQAISATTIHFTTAPHDNGIASIKVANAAGAAYGEFLFIPPRLQDLPPGYITTIAGIGEFEGFHRPATRASLCGGPALAFDRAGNLFLSEAGRSRVSRIGADGILEPYAGTGFPPVAHDDIGDGGQAADAMLNFPGDVTTDSSGNLYIGENHHRIRRVDVHTGIITTIAGNGTPGYSGDGGPAILALLNNATHITGDGNSTLFLTDYDDTTGVARIRRITPDGIISTIAGVGPPGFSGDGGPATQAQFNIQAGDFGALAVDSHGNVYVADYGNRRLRRIDGQTGIITTVAGDSSNMPGLCTVATDSTDNVYFSYFDSHGAYIVKMSPAGQVIATYGHGFGFSEDGTKVQDVSLPTNIRSLVIDSSGNVVFSDQTFWRVRRLNLTTGVLETLAGIGPQTIGENGPATAAVVLDEAGGDLAFMPTGELLVADAGHFRLRKIDNNGNIFTVAGPSNDLRGHFEDQPALGAYVFPVAVKADAARRIYMADSGPIIWRIDPDGIMRRVAGGAQFGAFGFSGDGGPALDAQLCQPWDLAFDQAGNLFIADTNNNRIRRVDAQTGTITTVAGSGPVNGAEHYGENGQGSYSGDGGPATQACLNTPCGVAFDSAGNLFIADTWNRRTGRSMAAGSSPPSSMTSRRQSWSSIALETCTLPIIGGLFALTAAGSRPVWKDGGTGALAFPAMVGPPGRPRAGFAG